MIPKRPDRGSYGRQPAGTKGAPTDEVTETRAIPARKSFRAPLCCRRYHQQSEVNHIGRFGPFSVKVNRPSREPGYSSHHIASGTVVRSARTHPVSQTRSIECSACTDLVSKHGTVCEFVNSSKPLVLCLRLRIHPYRRR